jgi:Fic family protein
MLKNLFKKPSGRRFKRNCALVDLRFNALEGSTLTKGETYFFLREGLTVEGKPFKDFLDARNHAEAIDYLYQILKDERPMTPGLMKEFNKLLLSGITYTEAINEMGQRVQKPATPGEYKRLPNHVLQLTGQYRYTEPLHVPAEMKSANGYRIHDSKTRSLFSRCAL